MEDHEVEKRVLESAKARMEEESEELLRWTRPAVRPLFAADLIGDPEHIGSAVLLRFHDRCFVATAAHVLDSATPHARVYASATSGVLCELAGTRVSSAKRLGLRELDRIDIGFIALNRECIAALSSCRFLTSDEICVDDLADFTPVVGSKYLVLGYPHQLAVPPKTG